MTQPTQDADTVRRVLDVIVRIDGETWEQAQAEDHPLWRALDEIDRLCLAARYGDVRQWR